jgi:hypothetical protein
MYDLRYNRQLAPLEQDESLALGAAFHNCLELWYKRDPNAPREQTAANILDFIDRSYPDRLTDDRQRKNWHLIRAMFLAYIDKYPGDNFSVVAVEREFRAPIVNPETGCASRTFIMRGKVDAMVEYNGRYFIIEHKTASSINGDYIERLPMDFQVMLYSDYLGQSMNIKVAGVLYNVVAKAQIKQGKSETEEEFEERRAKLIAKSKSGKSTAKQKVAETDDEFQKRLAAKYREKDMFHRELLYFYADQFSVLHSEVWELCQQLLLARRTGRWYMNTDYCFHFNRLCSYFPICRSNENPNVIENKYRRIEAHPELAESTPADTPTF